MDGSNPKWEGGGSRPVFRLSRLVARLLQTNRKATITIFFADLANSELVRQPSQSIQIDLIDQLMLHRSIVWPIAYDSIDP